MRNVVLRIDIFGYNWSISANSSPIFFAKNEFISPKALICHIRSKSAETAEKEQKTNLDYCALGVYYNKAFYNGVYYKSNLLYWHLLQWCLLKGFYYTGIYHNGVH